MPWTKALKNVLESRIMGWVIVILVVFSLGLSIYENQYARSYSHCVAQWAHESTTRMDRLTPLVTARDTALAKRNVALDELLGAAIKRKPASEIMRLEDRYIELSGIYLRAQRAYTAALAANPIPSSPIFTCH